MRVTGSKRHGDCDVLVVDDDDATVEIVTRYLSSRGVAARGITGDVDYLGAIRAAAPRVVLLDVVLPGANGYEICARVKGARDLRHVKVVLCTALPPASVITELRGSHADGYLPKPFALADLDAAIQLE